MLPAKFIRLTLTAACLCLMAGSGVLAQQAQAPLRGHEIDPGQLLKLPGEVISHGENDRPVGKLKVKTYRLERVKLDRPLQLGEGTLIEYVYHLIITGGPFVGPYTVWIDDMILPAFTFDSGHLVVQFFSQAPKFRQGATLSVTRGGDLESESVLPEQLSVPPELREELPSGDESSRIRLETIRWIGGQPAVQVIVATAIADPARNETLVVQIGKQEFLAGSGVKSGSAIIPYETFWRLPEGAWVIVKWGFGTPGGERIGRLYKNTLDH